MRGVAGGDVPARAALEARDAPVAHALVAGALEEDLALAAVVRDGVRGARLLVPVPPVRRLVAVVVARLDRQALAAGVEDEAVLVGVLVVEGAVRRRAGLEVHRDTVLVGEVAVHRHPAGGGQVERARRALGQGLRALEVRRRRHEELEAQRRFAREMRGVPAAQRRGGEVGVALAEARRLLLEHGDVVAVAEQARRRARRVEIGEEPGVVAHPGLLREVDARGPAHHVPVRLQVAGVPQRVGGAVGEAAVLAAPRLREVEGERQRLPHPAFRLGQVADHQRRHHAEHGGGELAVRVARLRRDSRALADDVGVHVAQPGFYGFRQSLLLFLVQF